MTHFPDIFMVSPPAGEGDPADESARVSRKCRLLRLLLVFLGGTLYAAALPPFNWNLLAFFTLVPLLLCAVNATWRAAVFAGWLWGLGWALFAFRFLREIHPAIPWLLAPIISLWPAVWAAALPWLWRNTLFPAEAEDGGFDARERFLHSPAAFLRLLLFSFSAAALFTLLEWTRSRLFTWNDLGVTMWRNTAILQIAAFAGGYGVNFLVALANAGVFAACRTRFRGPGLRVLLCVMLLLTLAMLGGMLRIVQYEPVRPNWFPALVQGDISQRRNASLDEAQEALDVYLALSSRAPQLAPKPELVVWPESAVPVPFRSTHPVSAQFRFGVARLIAATRLPMLIGSIDFEDRLPGDGSSGVTNSALFLSADGKLRHKYDKIHRVPFGEYIPFRALLPEFVIRLVDMNRDLTPGVNPDPVRLRGDVRAGTAICYEGVFGYLTREFARRGANVLVVLSNDAWYPVSSEPEQHLANAVMRAVETGLPMVRCGNNGGSGVVTPLGEFTQVLEVPGPEARLELRRGRGIATVGVGVEPEPEETFFVRHGEWFIAVLAALVTFHAAAALIQYRKRKERLLRLARQQGSTS